MTGVEYRVHRGRAWLLVFVLPAFGLAFVVFGLAMPHWGWRIVCLAVGAIAAIGAVHAVRMLSDKRPILRIAPDGLYSTLFADQVVPWSEITEMARLLYFNRLVVMGRVSWTRMPNHDQLHFAVADPRLYPNGLGRQFTRAMQRIGGLPPIAIQLWIVDADADAIFTEVAKYWKGEIKQIDPRPRHLIS